jgi:hypothetical protein
MYIASALCVFPSGETMTSEELNRTIEFIVRQNAQFTVNMDQLFRGLNDLKEQTARFESWAAEVVTIQSRRLDQNEERIRQNEERMRLNEQESKQGSKEREQLRRDILRLLNMILDRLPPLNN